MIPIADRHLPYAQEVAEKLKDAGLRVEVDDRGERMNAKIRDAQKQKIPYMLVVGDKEMESSDRWRCACARAKIPVRFRWRISWPALSRTSGMEFSMRRDLAVTRAGCASKATLNRGFKSTQAVHVVDVLVFGIMPGLIKNFSV